MSTDFSELLDALETVDCAVFTGDSLHDTASRLEIKANAERWLRAVGEYEESLLLSKRSGSGGGAA